MLAVSAVLAHRSCFSIGGAARHQHVQDPHGFSAECKRSAMAASIGGGGEGAGSCIGRKGTSEAAQKRFDRWWKEVAKAVGGGYCRLQMPLKPALAITGTVAGRSLGALQGGGGYLPPSNAALPGGAGVKERGSSTTGWKGRPSICASWGGLLMHSGRLEGGPARSARAMQPFGRRSQGCP